MKVCYPGTFDPITKGHLDIIERASKQFNEVVVLIMANPKKVALFTAEERKDMIEKSIKGLNNVKVEIGSGLTVEYAKKCGASALLRGIRAVSDYENELSQATANMELDDSIETIFLIARPEYSFVSSSIVKEIALFDGDIEKFVPKEIVDDILAKVKA